MRIILREDVPNLGKSGELVNVKDGFGRNYLLPRKLAVIASEQNVRQLEHEKQVIANRQAKLKAGAQAAAGKISNVSVTIKRKVGEAQKEGEVAKLYGSVTALDIAEALASAGHQIDRRTIHLPEPIKTLGTHEVEIRMHRDVTAKVKVEVAPE